MLCGPVGPETFLHPVSSAICMLNYMNRRFVISTERFTQRRGILRFSSTRGKVIPFSFLCGHTELAAESSQLPFALCPSRNMRGRKSLHNGHPSDATNR